MSKQMIDETCIDCGRRDKFVRRVVEDLEAFGEIVQLSQELVRYLGQTFNFPLQLFGKVSINRTDS